MAEQPKVVRFPNKRRPVAGPMTDQDHAATGKTIAFYRDRKTNAIVVGPPAPLSAREVRG